MQKFLTAPATIMLALLWLATGTFAQKTPEYETISTAQDLSQGMVFDMLQDQQLICKASWKGCNRLPILTWKNRFTRKNYCCG